MGKGGSHVHTPPPVPFHPRCKSSPEVLLVHSTTSPTSYSYQVLRALAQARARTNKQKALSMYLLNPTRSWTYCSKPAQKGSEQWAEESCESAGGYTGLCVMGVCTICKRSTCLPAFARIPCVYICVYTFICVCVCARACVCSTKRRELNPTFKTPRRCCCSKGCCWTRERAGARVRVCACVCVCVCAAAAAAVQDQGGLVLLLRQARVLVVLTRLEQRLAAGARQRPWRVELVLLCLQRKGEHLLLPFLLVLLH